MLLCHLQQEQTLSPPPPPSLCQILAARIRLDSDAISWSRLTQETPPAPPTPRILLLSSLAGASPCLSSCFLDLTRKKGKRRQGGRRGECQGSQPHGLSAQVKMAQVKLTVLGRALSLSLTPISSKGKSVCLGNKIPTAAKIPSLLVARPEFHCMDFPCADSTGSGGRCLTLPQPTNLTHFADLHFIVYSSQIPEMSSSVREVARDCGEGRKASVRRAELAGTGASGTPPVPSFPHPAPSL